jgi:UDP-N-acetylmuramate-alanine ligase
MKLLETLTTLGPSRRGTATVIEMVLETEGNESDRMIAIVDQLKDRLLPKLVSLGLEPDLRRWRTIPDRTEAMARLAGFFCLTALALQCKTGHKVQYEDFLEDKDPGKIQSRLRFIFEHDDAFTGRLAGDLAMRLLSDTCPELHWQAEFDDEPESIESSIGTILETARLLVTPPDVLDLVTAARDKGIPVIRLERDPYEPVQADFRVAPNGLVMLGQSCHQVLLDGLFCIQRPGPGFSLMQDRRSIWRLLAQLGVPTAIGDTDRLICTTLSRALRVARRVGYPLHVWPMQRDPEATEGWHFNDEAGLVELFSRPELRNKTFMIEPVPEGKTLDLIYANGQLLHAMREGEIIAVDPALAELSGRIDRAIDTGLLLLCFSIPDAPQHGSSNYLLTHLDPAPPLHRLLAGHDKLRHEALDSFLDWLIPPGVSSRVPVIAVTGTNGKTTTSTMISRIAKKAHRYVGMAQTGGVHFDGQLQEFGDMSGFFGHCRVFENPSVDMAVLETARGGIVTLGFTFEHCDVAVCTNVSADHLGEHGIETVEQMAVIKRSILERADKAVVLNGDDPHCLAMLPFLSASTIYLSTFDQDSRQLKSRTQADVKVINVEKVDGQDWIVLHDQEQTLPVISVDAIPATFNGMARHNISNAMHAIAACHAVGLDLAATYQALSGFEMSFESMPGRLNVHDNGRYHVIMDYAHNADGLRQLVRFTDQFPCDGRRILRFGVSSNALEPAIFAAAAAAAGHFDQYICSGKSGTQEGHIDAPEALKQGLLANGVPIETIAVTGQQDDAFDYPVSFCREGDLLVLITSRVSLNDTWQRILST